MRAAAGTDKRTLAVNAVCNWLTFAASAVVAFVMCPIMVRGLGNDGYGVWELVQALVGWFALLDMGVGAAVVRYVARFEALDEHNELNRVFNTTLAIFLAAGLLAALACGVTAALWKQPFGLSVEFAEAARLLIVILGANVALELVAGVFGATLYGLGRFPARLVIQTSVRIGGAVAIVIVLDKGGGLIEIAWISLAAAVVKGSLLFTASRYYLRGLRISPGLVDWQTFRTIRGYSLRAFIVMIAGRVSFRIDALVIGAFLLPAQVTYFVVGVRMLDYGKQAISSLTAVVTPAVTRHEAHGDMETIRRIYYIGSRYALWIAAPLAAGFIILGKEFFTLWIDGNVAENSFPVLIVLSVALPFAMSQVAGSRILYGIGELRMFTWLAVGQAILNLVMSVILVKPFGIAGVAWGTALPNVLFSALLVMLLTRQLKVDILDYFRYVLPGPLVGVIGFSLGCLFIKSVLPPETWLKFGIVGLAGFICTGILFITMEPKARSIILSLKFGIGRC